MGDIDMNKDKASVHDMSETEYQHAKRGHGGKGSGIKSRRTRKRQELIAEQERHAMDKPKKLETQTDGDLSEVKKDPVWKTWLEKYNENEKEYNRKRDIKFRQSFGDFTGDSDKMTPTPQQIENRRIKEAKEVKVGDTIADATDANASAIEGFEDVKPMVFAGIYPVDSDDYEDLRSSMEKLQLNDASLVFSPESSAALGFGFRCGFLGMLHLEIIQERLQREFNMSVITTVPNVSYHAYTKKDPSTPVLVNNPSDLPDPSRLDRVEEPFIKASIITKSEFVGNALNLCIDCLLYTSPSPRDS